MEQENKNQGKGKNVVIVILVTLVLVVTALCTLVIMNDIKSRSNEVDSTEKESDSFTDLVSLSLKDNESKSVNFNGKKISLKLKNDIVYLNDKKIYSDNSSIDNMSNNIIVTNRMILVSKPAGQYGREYMFYDLNGNTINYFGKKAQYNDLKVENGKLKVVPFIFDSQWMSGYRIGNLLTIEGDVDNCSGKMLKDYPNIIEEHKNDVLKADYYFYLSGNELTLKYDKILLTVGDLDKNTCVIEENNNNDTSTNDNQQTFKNSDEIDETILNNLYSIVGILPVDQYNRNNCLNMAISSNNYKENATKIFSWYAYMNNMQVYHEEDDACNGDNKCMASYGAASLTEISKTNATQIIFLYNLGNTLDSFLTTVPAYENLYYYGSQVGDPPVCKYFIEHNTDSKYLNSNSIRIVDNQKVTEKELPGNGNVVSTKDRIVTYDFVKENGGNYYLENVIVE